MFRTRYVLPAIICTACLISCSAPYSSDIGQPLDLTQVVVYVKYDTVLGMLVCSDCESTTHHQGYKFAMIWSRERSLPLPILKELKFKLGAYINQERIRMVDHRNC
ncbi:uncharacterized protein LOC108631169 [Ceratina calcarata]|uniref:Uncharacterized protein LOC108631169 n=1 Tax=Ceratina calcarata TaxID=156304 RepID=A0AAJ7NEF9_9HYME|nr:uncharacterized protein LOC108631169 [Ceratina calcarata]